MSIEVNNIVEKNQTCIEVVNTLDFSQKFKLKAVYGQWNSCMFTNLSKN